MLGPRVHGREYHRANDWRDSWLLLVTDQAQDTLNGELLSLPAANLTLPQLAPNQTLGNSSAGPGPAMPPLGTISRDNNATVSFQLHYKHDQYILDASVDMMSAFFADRMT